MVFRKEKPMGELGTIATGCILKGCASVRRKLVETKGQGTTEYAILVGVLVVIAILAIMLFKEKLASLWQAIADGINGL